VKKSRFLTRAVMRMAGREQLKASQQQHMSRVLWDMFTGSAPYYDVFLRCLHPRFWSRFILYMFVKPRALPEAHARQEESMNTSVLGKEYRRGQTIIRQGEPGDCMYVIQSGQAEVIQSKDGRDIQLALLGNQDTFGEMALYRMESRSATVRAVTDVRALTVDKKIFLRRAHEDPSFVFAILQKMSQRIYEMNTELTRRKNQSGSTLKS
jgi:hypothetical protein